MKDEATQCFPLCRSVFIHMLNNKKDHFLIYVSHKSAHNFLYYLKFLDILENSVYNTIFMSYIASSGPFRSNY